jgi:hypothetical protein
MIRNNAARLGLAILVLALAGCNVWQRSAEFAPPVDRMPGSQPFPVEANAPPPPIEQEYCYTTLAIVDCYPTKQPERYRGYTGQYPTE